MAILAMRVLGDPILRETCRPVEHFDATLERLAQDLLAAMGHYKGVGVAANQLGVGQRVFVYDDEGEPKWLVNPVIADVEGEETMEEGCLSLPDLYFQTRRATRLQVTGQDLRGDQVEFVAEDFLARIMQHETDHLNGLLYIDRLDEDVRRDAMREIRDLDVTASGV